MELLWNKNVSIEEFVQKQVDWRNSDEVCTLPIDANYALDVLFKTLVPDNVRDLPVFSVLAKSREQANTVMLDLILYAVSPEYRQLIDEINNKNR